MLLSKDQQNRFWREFSRVAALHIPDATNPEKTAFRRELLQRCGFDSLTRVDRSKGFDRVLAELGRLADNVARTAEVDNPEPGIRRNLMWLITDKAEALGGLPYALAIARDQYKITTGLTTLEDLQTEQLRWLVMTLTKRLRTRNRQNKTKPLGLAVRPCGSHPSFPSFPSVEFASSAESVSSADPF